jgi:toxin ParE1/3/4
MTSEFHPEARAEFLEAIAFYEERKLGLGTEFKETVQKAVTVIESDPSRYQRIRDEIRVFRLKRFPYYIYFEFLPTADSVWIWGVVHHRRRPDYWHDRLDR